MEINQLNPVEVVRDKTGSWIHPEFLKYLNSLDVKSETSLLFFWRPARAIRQEFLDLQGLRKKKTPGLQA